MITTILGRAFSDVVPVLWNRFLSAVSFMHLMLLSLPLSSALSSSLSSYLPFSIKLFIVVILFSSFLSCCARTGVVIYTMPYSKPRRPKAPVPYSEKIQSYWTALYTYWLIVMLMFCSITWHLIQLCKAMGEFGSVFCIQAEQGRNMVVDYWRLKWIAPLMTACRVFTLMLSYINPPPQYIENEHHKGMAALKSSPALLDFTYQDFFPTCRQKWCSLCCCYV